jgi:hypothetical protein
MRRLFATLATTLAAGCSSGPTCQPPAQPVVLMEGYCTNGEADRCYFDHNPADGF